MTNPTMTHPTLYVGAIAIAVCLSQPATAAVTQQDDIPEANAQDRFTASNRIRCRRLPPPVGQRFGQGRRVCATEAQWEAYHREIRNGMNEAFNRSKAFSNN